MKVYIAGPIDGIKDYKARFSRAEKYLFGSGHTPINPTKATPQGASRAELVKRGIKLLLDCDGIFLLDGWDKSPGASLEFEVAKETKLLQFYQNVHECKTCRL